MNNVLIFGSTGSVGISTLEVIANNPSRFRVWGIAANSNDAVVIEQIERYSPQYVVMRDTGAAERVSAYVRHKQIGVEVLAGDDSLVRLASAEPVDIVMAAIVGAAGLKSTLAAVSAGKRVLLANKESLVCAGKLFMSAVECGGATLMPVDSEHNAIFQCLPQGAMDATAVTKIILTGSGGPFRNWSAERLKTVTPAQACQHPNWDMGQKISVDSATMMNKGLEYIEACWLFGVSPNQIEILLHPQSLIHSMVYYRDGSILAHMGVPDMKTPIAHALSWPERIDSGVAEADFSAWDLQFEHPDLQAYPCLEIALDVAREMGAAPTVMNAANEVAVQSFLDRKIGFTAIAGLISGSLNRLSPGEPASIEEVLEIDAEARAVAQQLADGC